MMSKSLLYTEGRCGSDRMVVVFSTTCAISAYHLCSCENPAYGEVYSVQNLCDTVCQWLGAGRFFPPGISVSSTRIMCF